MVAHSLSDRFTSNVFVAGDQTTNGVTIEKLTHRKKTRTAVEISPLNIAANNLHLLDLTQTGDLDINVLLSISQQLCTPLRQITTPLEQLQDTHEQLSESERKQLYQIIGLHTAQILNLVDQLLGKQAKAPVAVHTVELPIPALAPPNARQITATGRRCSTHDHELLQKLYSLMEENLEETDFNVHKMCRMVHLSHMHLIRKVKQLTGKKPIDLLKSYRLKRAQELLRQNNLNVAEVAYKVGYDMPNSFSRAFKKEFGICPTEYK
jgi:AraC-like DNA-binding protein